jgi:hypothetical protein
MTMKIFTKATWVISNCHIEILVATKCVVNSSIPKGLGIYRGETNKRIKNFTNIPIVGVLLR